MSISHKIIRNTISINLFIPLILGGLIREMIIGIFNPFLDFGVGQRLLFSLKPLIITAVIVFSAITIATILWLLKPLFSFLKEGKERESARKVVLYIPWFLTIFHVVIWIIAVTVLYGVFFHWEGPGGNTYLTSLANSVSTGFITGILSALAMNNTLIPAKKALMMTDVRDNEHNYFLKWKNYLLVIAMSLNMGVFGAYLATFYQSAVYIPPALSKPGVSACFLFGFLGILFWIMCALSKNEDYQQAKLVQDRLDNLNETGGDLTKRIILTNFDNLGCISHSFNLFLDHISGMIREIGLAERELGATGEELYTGITEMEQALSASLNAFRGMEEHFSQQRNLVNHSTDAITNISRALSDLDNKISSEASIIEESSAAIEEMIVNFSSSTRNLRKTGELFNELRQLSDDGRSKMDRVISSISEVREQAKKLEEANSLIAGIAAQTNLLAMNAAIEAAHAGDAGRGFAVVADEIRKLAANSSSRSKEVSSSLKTTGNLISQVVSEVGGTGEAFNLLREKLEETHTLEGQVLASMTEQETGGREVLSGLDTMKDHSVQVKETASAVRQDSSSIHAGMEQLRVYSEELKETLGSVIDGANSIEKELEKIQILGKNNEVNIHSIEKHLNQFQV